MHDPIFKQYPVTILKQNEDGSQDIVISTDAVDRDGDVIEVDGWELENYLNNPVVLFAHNYSSVPIGRTLDLRREPGALVARFAFREAANEFDPVLPVRAAWDQGILRAASVGFKPLEFEPLEPAEDEEDALLWFWGPKRFKKQELLEWSVVPVPANQDALRRAFEAYVKSLGVNLTPGHVFQATNALSTPALPDAPPPPASPALPEVAEALLSFIDALKGHVRQWR